MSVGIPLHKLVGVPEFLERWQKKHPEVTHIAAHDDQGNALWQSHSAASPSSDAPITTGSSELQANGMTRAGAACKCKATASRIRAGSWPRSGSAILPISSLAYLAAHFSCAQGPWLRNHGLRIIARWAARGDYRRLLALSQHKSFDLRVQELAHAMRRVHERMARMRQLISLLATHRATTAAARLSDQILKKTIERPFHGQRTQNRSACCRSVPIPVDGTAALPWCNQPPGLFSAVSPRSLQQYRALGSGVARRILGLFILVAAAGSGLSARLRISTLSVLLLSNTALALPLLALVLGSEIHPCWLAIWNACRRRNSRLHSCPNTPRPASGVCPYPTFGSWRSPAGLVGLPAVAGACARLLCLRGISQHLG